MREPPYTEKRPIGRAGIWWNELGYDDSFIESYLASYKVGERGTYVRGHIDEMVDISYIRQVESSDANG